MGCNDRQRTAHPGSILDVGVELGLIKKSGSWYTYEGEQLGQGRENVKTFLAANPQLMAELDQKIREKVNGTVVDGLTHGMLPADDEEAFSETSN